MGHVQKHVYKALPLCNGQDFFVQTMCKCKQLLLLLLQTLSHKGNLFTS